MNQQQREDVFHAQTQNVRGLETAWAHLNRQINALILQKNNKSVEVTTKLLAVIYYALAESKFSKLIHTPNGLSIHEIIQAKHVASTQGVKFGWLKCSELALQRVAGVRSSHGPNVFQKLSRLIEQFIFDPSLVRNKLAHGQ
jgi:hypothetical protein